MRSRHIHPGGVTGDVMRGAWRYLEHDGVAHEGRFVHEPPGEAPTLGVGEAAGGPTGMITVCHIAGVMVCVDLGLGADGVGQFVR